MPHSKRKFKFRYLALAIAVALIAFRLYLPTLMKNYINKELNKDPAYRGGIERVGVHLWRGAYEMDKLRIFRVEGDDQFPLLAADVIDIGISWKELFHKKVLAKLEIKNLVVNILDEVEGGKKKVTVGANGTKEQKIGEAKSWKQVFRELVPLDVSQLTIDGGSIHFRDLAASPKVDVFLDELYVHAFNLTNSTKIAKSLFATVNIKARAMKSGLLHAYLYLDPFATPPNAQLQLELHHLDLTNLNDFFTAYAKFDVKRGSIDIFSEVVTKNNEIHGYIKPLIHDLKVSNLKKDLKKGGLFHAIWEMIVGAVGWVFKNFPHHQQGAVIPIEGRLDDPHTNAWKIFTSVLHNMFVHSLKPSLNHTTKAKSE